MHAAHHDHHTTDPHEHDTRTHDHTAAHRPHEEHVVLEIGGELGALIVYTDRRCCTRRSRSARPATTTPAATRTCSSASSAGGRSTRPCSTSCRAGRTRSGTALRARPRRAPSSRVRPVELALARAA